MQRENDRLGRLVVDLLLLTRIDANGGAGLRLEPLLLPDVIDRAVNNMRVLAGEHDLRAEIAPAACAACVRGDSDQLYRVLVNLLDNAIRYTPPTGHITVTLEMEGCANGHGPAKSAVLSVEDDGCGIEPEQLPRVFDRFYRADQSRSRQTGNAGLGLAIAKSIVEAHGGRIEVESEPGQGARFRMWLPVDAVDGLVYTQSAAKKISA